jgi:mono/diheme cytochrome c family protein
MMRTSIVFAAALFVLPGMALAQGAPQTAPQSDGAKGDGAKGKAIFLADGCYECHGTVGQGGRLTGPRLARTQLPLDSFMQQLRQPSNEMPPYEAGVLSDQDAANIYAYLQSLPAPMAAKDIPLLKP